MGAELLAEVGTHQGTGWGLPGHKEEEAKLNRATRTPWYIRYQGAGR